jgi:uncharacterized protein (DUF1015 family)
MAEVQAFRGIRYRLQSPEEAGAVIAPPYDVISPADQQALHERHPHNVVRLELPRTEPGDESSRYEQAASVYRQWREAGVLRQDEEPSIYLYGQRYEAEGRQQERLGVLAALRVEPFEAGVVLPHEQTFPKDKEDRYLMLATARAQFSPIFGLYSAPEAKVRESLSRIAAGPPAAAAIDREGVEHRLWPVTDTGFAAWVSGVFGHKQVFIADGHHRYETALRYRNERRAAGETGDGDTPPPHDYVMTFLVEMDDPGLILLPTHRLVRSGLPPVPELRRKLEPYFRIEPVALAEADALAHHQIGIVLPGGDAWRLTLTDVSVLDRLDTEHSAAWRDLDVVLLHRLVLEQALGLGEHPDIVYTRSPSEARERVVSGEFTASFLLPSPRVEELKLVAGAGDKMPHKSTYFWPKAVTGLVIYPQS